MNDELQALSTVLHDLAVVLRQGDTAGVEAVEPRLAATMAAVRAAAQAVVPTKTIAVRAESGAASGEMDRRALAALAEQVRGQIAVCRRLGGTVPALVSVMFPGQGLYGRDGVARAAVPARPGRSQVI